ncbi:hypothetical protein [Rheinheimera aquimaris]|uniref:hypothetical protein n=1 Tax=Rheinheimera aquimaris TaxID=412437 RepID=UPI001E4FA406|nr:hypothetical protein [Rheinheimera aquimaris]MCD1598224.1 hypothetical protein [Rheinheimera aquimaris]
MTKKPDLTTAMLQLIADVKQQMPLYEPSTFICGSNTDCIGCPKKMLEMVDSELSFWEHAIKQGRTPKFDELRQFGKLCQSVRRMLIRNKLMPDLAPSGKS